MLNNGVMEDGQWHEPSTRYHGRVLAAFIPFAYALREANITDAFNENANFKNFVGWYRLVQTPQDETFGNCSLTPALSDGNCEHHNLWVPPYSLKLTTLDTNTGELVWEITLGWAAGAYSKR